MWMPSSAITRWPLRGGWGIWKRKGLRGGMGLTAESIAALDAAWQRYGTAIGAPLGARSRRKALTEQLPGDFRAAEEHFATLDDFTLQFDDAGGTGTRFIDSWFNARRVQDTGRRAARPATPPAPPAPPRP